MNIWQGQRVRLRGIKVEDWTAFHQNDEDTQSAAASDAIYPPRCEAGTKAWAERQAAKCFDGHDMMLAIETIDGQLVGSINAHPVMRAAVLSAMAWQFSVRIGAKGMRRKRCIFCWGTFFVSFAMRRFM